MQIIHTNDHTEDYHTNSVNNTRGLSEEKSLD